MAQRIFTTHTGSLPRPSALLTALAAKNGDAEHHLRAAVRDCVEHQVRSGVDVVGDGELSKPSYSTYVTDRLSGFGGHGHLPMPADVAEYPSYQARLFADPGIAGLATPLCVGPVKYVNREPLERDLENLRHATADANVRGVFMTAASPGVIALFLENHYYRTHGEYLAALATAMRVEYEAITAAGFILQIDAPDLTMDGHMSMAHADLNQFRRRVALHVEAINAATANIPPERMRLHVCWGNYEGPHHRDVPLDEIRDEILRARPSGLSFTAANPRHEHEWYSWLGVPLARDKYLIPGVIDSTTNFIEHPELVAQRIHRFVDMVGAERVQAGTDCGFGTFAGLATVDPAIVWGKLEALAAGAHIASSRLRTSRPEAVSHPW